MSTTDAKAENESPAPAQAQADAASAVPPQAPASDLLAAAKKEAADNYDRYVRSVADLENFRRRAVREKEELRLYAASRLLEDLLPAIDNLALGLDAAKQPGADLKALTGGVELVQQQLRTILGTHGLKEVNPAGAAFDPHLHESIAHEASADVPAEHVTRVVRVGYTLNGRLLRPASVVVSSGKPA
jgi:molecular chaperone GrpE